ncbi:hypothetical protein TNCV_2762161 [Trichonephila clavipes]|nr:hypothetical protein TNCV_2762161 [Trichonephila clavipes]
MNCTCTINSLRVLKLSLERRKMEKYEKKQSVSISAPMIREKSALPNSNMALELNEDDIEDLTMGHEDELTIEELQETKRNVSPSE